MNRLPAMSGALGAVISFLLILTPAWSKLLSMSFEDFTEYANCACVVEVTDVEEVSESEFLAFGVSSSEVSGLNRLARLRVLGWIVEGPCSGTEDEKLLAFATEVHSSHPEPGRRFVVVPRRVGSVWAEVIYGRSVWEINAVGQVAITHRNDFLMAPLELRSGEVAWIPLPAIERLLESSLRGSGGD